MFRLPLSTTTKAVNIEVQRQVTAMHAQVAERQRLHELAHHQHAHEPTDPLCEVCTEAKMQQGDGDRGPLQPNRT